jgi:hypothetical protein
MLQTLWMAAGPRLGALAVALSIGAVFGVAPSDAQTPAGISPGRVIATAQLDGGYQFEFVDDTAAGTVGVGEIAPARYRSVLGELTDRQGATPLEVFLAVAPPGTTAPRRLVDDHAAAVRRTGRTNTAPRTLSLTGLTGPATFGGGTTSLAQDCQYDSSEAFGHSQWAKAWHFEHLGKDLHAEETYQNRDLAPSVPLSQRVWYAGSTGSRWLAACHGETQLNFGKLDFSAQYKNSSGTWVSSWNKSVSPQYQVRYSSSYGAKQWRIKLDAGELNSVMDVGVAVAGSTYGFQAPGN